MEPHAPSFKVHLLRCRSADSTDLIVVVVDCSRHHDSRCRRNRVCLIYDMIETSAFFEVSMSLPLPHKTANTADEEQRGKKNAARHDGDRHKQLHRGVDHVSRRRVRWSRRLVAARVDAMRRLGAPRSPQRGPIANVTTSRVALSLLRVSCCASCCSC